MPKTRRDFMKRTVAQAVLHLETAASDLIPLEQEFLPVHPTEAQFLTLTISTCDLAISLLARFCVAAWGYAPDDWDTWRNPVKHKPKDDSEPGESSGAPAL